jgi:hypothetical protein
MTATAATRTGRTGAHPAGPLSDAQLAALTPEERADLARRLAALTGPEPDPPTDAGRSGAPADAGRSGAPADAGRSGAPTDAGRSGAPAGAWRRWVPAATVAVAVTGTLVLAAWIWGLARTLPHRYLADNWNTAWIGYDLALLAGLALTGWAAWRGSALLLPAAFTTAILLVCDAWFDVMTAATVTDRTASALVALVAELPLAVGLLWVARPMIRVDAPG